MSKAVQTMKSGMGQGICEKALVSLQKIEDWPEAIWYSKM